MAAVQTAVAKPASAKTPSAPACSRVVPDAPLTFFDRCDCSAVAGDKNGRARRGFCSAQALVRVTLMTGGQILFCGHHYADHGPKITKVEVVHDEREQGEVARSALTTPGLPTPLVSAR
jgi:hypothetical protein